MGQRSRVVSGAGFISRCENQSAEGIPSPTLDDQIGYAYRHFKLSVE